MWGQEKKAKKKQSGCGHSVGTMSSRERRMETVSKWGRKDPIDLISMTDIVLSG